MVKKFGDKYRAYQQRVPMFWPDRYDWPRVIAELMAVVGRAEQ